MIEHTYPDGFTCGDLSDKMHRVDSTEVVQRCFPNMLPCYRTGQELLIDRGLLAAGANATTQHEAMLRSTGVLCCYWLGLVGISWISLYGRRTLVRLNTL